MHPKALVLQDLTTVSDPPESKDSSVRQAIEDVLARVDLSDSPQLHLPEEEVPLNSNGAQQKAARAFA